MRKEEADPDTRLAGTQALYNALAFVKKNFDNETERNYIMQTVCEGTQCDKQEVKVIAYECIVQIAELYYDKLPQYMPALYQLTLAAIQKATSETEVRAPSPAAGGTRALRVPCRRRAATRPPPV